ncbi:hypothetical protein [Pseudomonas pohangensis]|uniref:hypothetical protein n=1 Tax=Pseudomonas pohangensis TaxID=364197 RepID=UPI000B7FDAB8|nr:hypothetical protein [Pseudomonas pohangensis]
MDNFIQFAVKINLSPFLGILEVLHVGQRQGLADFGIGDGGTAAGCSASPHSRLFIVAAGREQGAKRKNGEG